MLQEIKTILEANFTPQEFSYSSNVEETTFVVTIKSGFIPSFFFQELNKLDVYFFLSTLSFTSSIHITIIKRL